MNNFGEVSFLPLSPVSHCHELKFVVSASVKKKISQFLQQELKFHSAKNRQSLLNRLYFNSASLRFDKQCLFGMNGRFNFFVTRQMAQNQQQYFVDIRRKQGLNCAIYRATTSADEWLDIVNNRDYTPSESESDRDSRVKRLVAHIAKTYNLQPEILTQYQRVSYRCEKRSQVRVTIDSQMKYQSKTNCQLDLDEQNNVIAYNYKKSLSHNQSTENYSILKLSFALDSIPTWVSDFVIRFNLQANHIPLRESNELVAHFDADVFYHRCERKLQVY